MNFPYKRRFSLTGISVAFAAVSLLSSTPAFAIEEGGGDPPPESSPPVTSSNEGDSSYSHGGHRGHRQLETVALLLRIISRVEDVPYTTLQELVYGDGHEPDFSRISLQKEGSALAILCATGDSLQRTHNGDIAEWIAGLLQSSLGYSTEFMVDVLRKPRAHCSAWYLSRMPKQTVDVAASSPSFYVTEAGVPFLPGNERLNACLRNARIDTEPEDCEPYHVSGTQWRYRNVTSGEMVYFRWSGDPFSMLLPKGHVVIVWNTNIDPSVGNAVVYESR